MMISLQSYVRRGRHTLRRWLLDPRVHIFLRAAGYVLSGFFLSAASLGHRAQPLAMSLVCACTGWPALLSALGGAVGYYAFWGSAGSQGMLWLAAGLLTAGALGDRRITRETPLLLPATAGLIVAAAGVVMQSIAADTTPVMIYILRILLAAGATGLFSLVMQGRNPVLDWLTAGVAVLALAQVMPVPYLGLGFVAGGLLTVAGAFPAAALAGLALDLAQVTQVPMTAVVCLAYMIRFLPRYPQWLIRTGPASVYIVIMVLCGQWDLLPLPALLVGGLAGGFVPGPGKVNHRRGETGVAQVRLELAAGVLAQTEQLLLEAPIVPVDEDALVTRAAERACSNCPSRKSCKDARRIAQLSAMLLHKPLLTVEELPIICRKSGRFLAELHRSQEHLRSIRADRERQREYRAAVIQQYQFLARYLQELSDQLGHRNDHIAPCYEPEITVHGNRPEGENGDRCLRFAGTMCRYYVVLCDGMGTGLGAVQEGRTAGTLLRRLLTAGYPAEHALRSLNSICALRDRAGIVTVDMAELHLDTGKAVLYKWGAAPSYLVTTVGAEKIGTAGPPPGLSVTDYRETSERLSLRRGETLVMVSDGISEGDALRCCLDGSDRSPGELAAGILSCGQLVGEDDATVITVRLYPSTGS